MIFIIQNTSIESNIINGIIYYFQSKTINKQYQKKNIIIL